MALFYAIMFYTHETTTTTKNKTILGSQPNTILKPLLSSRLFGAHFAAAEDATALIEQHETFCYSFVDLLLGQPPSINSRLPASYNGFGKYFFLFLPLSYSVWLAVALSVAVHCLSRATVRPLSWRAIGSAFV